VKILYTTACCYAKVDPIECCVASAALCDVPLTYYGLGHPSSNYIEVKIERMLDFMKEEQHKGYTHIFYTDGADAFFMASPTEIEKKYRFLHEPPLIVSTELEGPGLCAGGYMGEWDTVRQWLERLKVEYDHVGGNDQPRWIAAWKDHPRDLILDGRCLFWQTMSGGAHEHLEWSTDGRLRNKQTGYMPAILHFNGRTGGNGVMKEWYDQWTQRR
jgi:hypothetical protein